jgi:broad specificity phosphatase PhoE
LSIVLLRHGETALNAARVLQPADTALSPRGLTQARAAARALATRRIAAIVSSDLPRAWQTADALARLTGLEIAAEPLLQERNFGDLRGRPYDTLGYDPLAMDAAPPGGESFVDFQARVAQAFARLVERRSSLQGDVVAVSHGLVIHAMLAAHATLDATMPLPERIGNASITVLGAGAPHRVAVLDDVRHLQGIAMDDPTSLSGG